MLVVKEANGVLDEVFCYDNEKDPYQLNKIAFDQLAPETGDFLRKELTSLLEATNDKWYQQRIVNDFFSY